MRRRIRLRMIMTILSLTMILSLSSICPVAAEEEKDTDQCQIIFLLDASKSMKDNGQWESAVDSAVLISSFLPSDYETALLAYNGDVAASQEFGTVTSGSRDQLVNLELQGYTNPAAALQRALGMFAEDESIDKHIVFISDGEISMQDKNATDQAVSDYKEAVRAAVDQKIRLDMFILEDEETEDQISQGAEDFSGTIIHKNQSENLEDVAVQYLFEELGLEKIELGVSQTANEKMNVDLRDCQMENAKILLEAEQNLEDIHVSGQFEELNIIKGKRFAVAKLREPLDQQVVLEYTLSDRGRIRAYLLKEYELTVSSQSKYLPEEHSMRVTVDILNHREKEFMENPDAEEKVDVLLDGKSVDYTIEDGKIQFLYPIKKTKKAQLTIDFKKLNSKVHCEQMTQEIKLVVPEEKPDYRILLSVLAGLCAVILIIIYLCDKKKQKKNVEEDSDEIRKKEDEKSYLGYEFSGQITIYVLKNQNEDIAPCSLRLYGRDKKSFSFDWVKDCCGIRTTLRDADKIRFYGGKDHTLCLKNHGYATIVKGREILPCEKKYSLSYGEKILFIFNDGEIEIELHYKNMRPNERERWS